MAGVRMVQVAVHQVIDMVAMRHGRMSALRAMHVVDGVIGAGMAVRAGVGIGLTDGDRMLFDFAVAARVVQVAVVQVIDMTFA